MYIRLALLWSWGELYTEESEGENEFGSGENQQLMKTKKEVLNEPLGHICISGESENDEFGENHVGGAWS